VIYEVIHFLLMVMASVCGILLGARLAQAWENYKLKMKCRKIRRK